MNRAAQIDSVTIAVGAVTDTGLKRKANEDSYLAESPAFLVADGMGGYEAGDQASAAVVAAFRQYVRGPSFPTLADVRAALIAAEAGVEVVADQTERGAGSTVTGVILIEHDDVPYWLIFNVGDSRVYRHYGSELEQLTIDHSLGQELVDQGTLRREDLATFPERNVITRAIGAADSAADSWLMPVVNGERLMICSDGLYSEVPEEAIRATLTMNGRPESAAESLVQQAKNNGGHDNITVIVLDVVSGGGSLAGEYTTGARLTEGELDDSLDDTTIPV